MIYQKLFSQGRNYTDYIAQGSEAEQQAVSKVTKKLVKVELPTELQKKLATINTDVKLLIVGEMWCPDCQLNIAAIEQLTLLQPKIQCVIISKEQAENNLLSALSLNSIKIPLVLILDRDYQNQAMFIERSDSVLKHENFSQIKASYFAGDYLLDTMVEIINKLPV